MYSGGTATMASCAALIPPQTVNGNFLQIVTDKGTVTYSLSSKAFATGQSYTFNITVNLAAIGSTVAITNWNANGSATVNPTVVNEVYRQAVDLGLSVKWANMNVGASSPTDYGMYFMWGDVAGHPGVTTDGFSFNYNNYRFGNYSSFSKYNTTDGKLKLDAVDDAATANWGSSWRMPTKAEFEELKNNCQWTAVSSPVAGCLVTSKKAGYTSNSIFLPRAGIRFNNDIVNTDKGYYWSSESPSAGAQNVTSINIYSYGSAAIAGDQRAYGLLIRPVQP